MLTVDLHTDGDSAFGHLPKERPIIFDDVALFGYPVADLTGSRFDHNGLHIQVNRTGGGSDCPLWRSRVPDVADNFPTLEERLGKDDEQLSGLVIRVGR